MAMTRGSRGSPRSRVVVVLLIAVSGALMFVPSCLGAHSGLSFRAEPLPQARAPDSVPSAEPAALPSGTTWNWVNSTLPSGPSPRAGAAMVYDPTDGYTLLFGGCPSWGGDYWTHNCTAIGDTWKLADGVWTNITASLSGPSPPPRADAGIAYDSTDHVVVLFGGFDGETVYGDTWTYAAGHWTQMHPAVSPAARFTPGMAGDAAGAVILFGGANSTLNTVVYGDTWSYVGGVWTHLSTSSAPAARSAVGMAYDPAGGFDLLYGGFNASVGSYGDTWSFADGVWTELSSSSAPPVENYACMAFDLQANAMIMTGGHLGYDVYPDTWAFNSSGWQEVPTSAHPTPSWGLSLSYDPATGGVWLFGGYYATVAPYGVYLGSTWEFVPVIPDHYAVTFSQVGLPAETPWTVTLGSEHNTTTETAMVFEVENGTYPYSVGSVAGYAVVPSSGLVVIAGGGATVGLAFMPDIFNVTFSESGLPQGTSWNVTFAGLPETATERSITFHVGNGEYAFRVANLTGFSVSPQSGTVVVFGNAITVQIVFTAQTSSFSATTFLEGLLVGAVVAGVVVAGVFWRSSKRPSPSSPPDQGK